MDLVEEFSDGRIQFAFVKVKDPNTTLPKSVLIAWVRLFRMCIWSQLIIDIVRARRTGENEGILH